MHTHTCLLSRCLLLKRYSNLYNKVIMLLPLILRMITYIFLLLRIIITFCDLFHKINHISGEFLPFSLATGPRAFTFLTKSILFLCCHKGFLLIIYLDDIQFLVQSTCADKRAFSFLCSINLPWATY